MTDHPDNQFDDQKLKNALKRQFASVHAPQALRNRIARDFSAQPARPLLRLGRWVAVAAVLALALLAGMLAPARLKSAFHSTSHPSLPDNLASAIVDRHDVCCQAIDHQRLPFAKAFFNRIGPALEQQLRSPVLAADLQRDGWSFRGAGVCQVATTPAAHLLFDKGQATTVSVITLPLASVPGSRDGQHYSLICRSHPISAVARQDTLLCMVGRSSGHLTTADLDTLLAAHAAEVIAVPASKQAPGSDTELMH